MTPEQRREYYQKNKEKLKEQQRTYYYLNYHKRKERNRDFKLRREFGLELGEYKRLFLQQNECCAICNTHQTEKARLFAVDHSHTTGKIRGLLCINCNTALGHVKDSVSTLEKMISYLKTHDG
jgi:hypothetical protein